MFTSSGSMGGGRGNAKTIISPNTSFGDIMRDHRHNYCNLFQLDVLGAAHSLNIVQ